MVPDANATFAGLIHVAIHQPWNAITSFKHSWFVLWIRSKKHDLDLVLGDRPVGMRRAGLFGEEIRAFDAGAIGAICNRKIRLIKRDSGGDGVGKLACIVFYFLAHGLVCVPAVLCFVVMSRARRSGSDCDDAETIAGAPSVVAAAGKTPERVRSTKRVPRCCFSSTGRSLKRFAVEIEGKIAAGLLKPLVEFLLLFGVFSPFVSEVFYRIDGVGDPGNIAAIVDEAIH